MKQAVQTPTDRVAALRETFRQLTQNMMDLHPQTRPECAKLLEALDQPLLAASPVKPSNPKQP